jgi:serine/threonine protein kinase
VKWMMSRYDEEQSRLRFLREAQAIGRVRHPSVVDIYDVESSAAGTYLVMELLEGETLRDRLKRGRLDVTDAVEFVLTLLDALRVAHRQGVIHRDLKPENVFLARNDTGGVTLKVLDFGISTLTESEVLGSSTLTKTGQFVGTPLYTPLERLRDKQEFDHRVDVYSVGVILYESLTGVLPFSAHSLSELTFQLATTDPVSVSRQRADVSPALAAIVMQSLARDPSARPADVETFARQLRSAVPGLRTTDSLRLAASPAIASAPVESQRPRLPIALLGAAVLALGGVAYLARPRVEPVLESANPSAVVAVTPSAPARTSVPAAGAPTRPSEPAPSSDRSTSERPRALARPSPVNVGAELTVVVFPFGNVWIDGRKVGAAPVTITVPAGPHVIGGGRDTPERQSALSLKAGESRRVVLSWKERPEGSAASAVVQSVPR